MNYFFYIAISINPCQRFGKYSYLLNIEKNESGKLLIGKKLTFGFLEKGFKLGAKKGWFIQDVSIGINEFDKYFINSIGYKKVKIVCQDKKKKVVENVMVQDVI